MARIPTFEAGLSSQATSPNPIISDSADSIMARAVEGFGRSISDTGSTLAQAVRFGQQEDARKQKEREAEQEDEARLWALQQMADIRVKMTESTIDAQTDIEPGAPGYAAHISNELATLTESIRSTAPSSVHADKLDESLINFRSNLAVDSIEFERNAMLTHEQVKFESNLDIVANQLLRDPSDWQATMGLNLEILDEMSGVFTGPQQAELEVSIKDKIGGAAISGMLLLDPRLARETLEQGLMDDVLSVSAMESAWTDVKREEERVSAEMKYAVGTAADNSIAEILSGNTDAIDSAPSVEQVTAALGGTAGQQYGEQLRNAVAISDGVRQLKFATPSQANEILDEFEPEFGSPTFAQDQANHEALVKHYASLREVTLKDPAGYLSQTPRIQRFIEDGDEVSALHLLQAEMDRHGIPKDKQKFLPNSLAVSITDQLARAQDATSFSGTLTTLSDTYGEFTPQILGQLGERENDLNILISMQGEPGFDQVFNATRLVSKESAANILNTHTIKESDVRVSWRSEISDFQNSIASISPDRNELFVSMEDIAVNMVAQEIARGVSKSTAVSNTYNRLIGDRYTRVLTSSWSIFGSDDNPLFIPNRIDGQDMAPQFIGRWLMEAKEVERLSMMNIRTPANTSLLPDDIANEDFIKDLHSQAYWVLSPDGTGVDLYYNNVYDEPIPVLQSNGSNVRYQLNGIMNNSYPTVLPKEGTPGLEELMGGSKTLVRF